MAVLESTAIAPLFGPDVITAEGVPALVDDQLFPEELASITRAVPKRRAEFGAVRLCARRALAQLGVAPGPLVPAPDRSPRWPEGIVGSMTHTGGYCAVAVARAGSLRSVGLDAEHERVLEPALLRMICRPEEQRALAARSGGAADAIVHFAAKEAFYKCQYPLTHTFLDFLDVEVDVDFTAGRYRVRVVKSLASRPVWLDHTEGRFLRRDGLVLCGSELR
ncbi:MAG: 4'-phosphopantetheinyl transferase superfamily protein [Polyangiales bacterium]